MNHLLCEIDFLFLRFQPYPAVVSESRLIKPQETDEQIPSAFLASS
jgi:hypothetical protein